MVFLRQLNSPPAVPGVDLDPTLGRRGAPDWTQGAACRGQTALFFPTHAERPDARELREADWSVHREGVTHSGGDRLPPTSFHSHPEGRNALHGEPYRSLKHSQAPPCPLRNPVSAAQTGREGIGVERTGCPGQVESFGQ